MSRTICYLLRKRTWTNRMRPFWNPTVPLLFNQHIHILMQTNKNRTNWSIINWTKSRSRKLKSLICRSTSLAYQFEFYNELDSGDYQNCWHRCRDCHHNYAHSGSCCLHNRPTDANNTWNIQEMQQTIRFDWWNQGRLVSRQRKGWPLQNQQHWRYKYWAELHSK